MLFSSISFIYFFLPAVLLLYYGTPKKYKNLILMISSLLFYFSGEAKYIGLLLFSTLVDYFHSRIIENNRNSKKAKYALISSIFINMTMLLFFKYADFFITNWNLLFHTQYKLLHISLPIGISFFTFQTMSYTIDVYRGDVKAQKSLISLGTYITLFPQLIAGPIVRYKTIEKNLNNRHHSYGQFAYGVKRFVIGLSKKVIIANSMGELIHLIEITGDVSVLSYWLIAMAYTLQIYYDFSGYSDMAIGLGYFFGFRFMENFNYPYVSKSITEFWQRWHISLGLWFRDYVYIPLGGNRVSRFNWYKNILLVWFLTGFWHGAAWTFVIWGLIFAVVLICEKAFLLKRLKTVPSIVSHFYVLFIVVLSFVIFKNETLSLSFNFYKGMFALFTNDVTTNISLYYLKSYLPLFITSIVGATPLYKKFIRLKKTRQLNYFEPLIYVVLLLISTGYLVDASFNPFLYFRF